MRAISTKFFYVLVCLSLMFVSFGVQPVYAAIIVVNTNADTVNDDDVCTLREAITTANSDTPINGGGAGNDCNTGSGSDTITFAGSYTITLGSQLPAVSTTITINGKGKINSIVQGVTSGYRVFEVSGTGNLTLNDLAVQNGSCNSGGCATVGNIGGGIYNNGSLTLNNALIASNSAAYGGGVYNNTASTLTVTNSTFTSNLAFILGAEDGSAIMNNGGTVNITGSTFNLNHGNGVAGIITNYINGTMTITNSTITANTFGSGGGHVVFSNGTSLTIKNSTIANNSIEAGGYAGVSNQGGTLNISNSIVYGHINGYDCIANTGTLGTNTSNIIGVNGTTAFNTCGTASNSNPLLDTLSSNGGETQTLALLTGSPAINTADNTTCASAPANNLDQRGVTRPINTNCDIGAYEKMDASGFPTFVDVPTNAFGWSHIEAIYDFGITGGCTVTPLNYCPNNTVTRAQMAIFLLRGIHGSAYTPPAATGTLFTDVPISHPFAAWIEQLSNEGITGGCGGGNYCPNGIVSRSQMAIFLLRAKYGSSYIPPAATGTMFTDVPLGTFAPWIEQLANEGITGGCGGGNYCPNNNVTRAQMAIFIQRTFSLPLP